VTPGSVSGDCGLLTYTDAAYRHTSGDDGIRAMLPGRRRFRYPDPRILAP
jgi:hypothetical protein